ncbi:hypothetical protein ACTFBV_05785 [Aeromonas rivipollensis]
MQLHEPPAPGLADSVSLPPVSQWRHSVEQGRRLEGTRGPDLYQMLLAWFQHEILGLLCGLLFFLPSSISDSGRVAWVICTSGNCSAITCNFASATATSVLPLAGRTPSLSLLSILLIHRPCRLRSRPC